MVCPKCGAINDEMDTFCFSCGAPLKLDSARENFQGGDVERDPDGYPVYNKSNGGAMPTQNRTASSIAVGSRKAIEEDLKGLRPVTRMAYYVVQSDNTTWIRLGLYVLFIGACMGILVAIKTIYEELRAIVETSAFNSAAETPLVELFRSTTAQHGEKLISMVILLFVVVFFYIVLGRLILRIKKVKRKRKKVEQKDMV